MVSSVTGCKPSSVKRDCVTLDNGNRPGIVTVVDIQNIHNDHVSTCYFKIQDFDPKYKKNIYRNV